MKQPRPESRPGFGPAAPASGPDAVEPVVDDGGLAGDPAGPPGVEVEYEETAGERRTVRIRHDRVNEEALPADLFGTVEAPDAEHG